MKPTRVERLILMNQYAILAKLDPSNAAEYEKAEEVFRRGYESMYDSYPLGAHVYEDADTFSVAEATEVYEILDMFRATERAYEELEDKSGIPADAIKYGGFDGNSEGKQYGFVLFLKKDNRYNFLKGGTDGDNSHMPMLDLYRRMKAEWEKSADRNDLTREDLLRIAGAVNI